MPNNYKKILLFRSRRFQVENEKVLKRKSHSQSSSTFGTDLELYDLSSVNAMVMWGSMMVINFINFVGCQVFIRTLISPLPSEEFFWK